MKQLIKALLVVCCMLSGLLPAAAVPDAVAPNSIAVVTDDNYPPYVFRNPDGQLEVYIVDFWKLWEQKTGVRVLDSAVELEFQTQWDAIVDKLSPLMIATNTGAPTWQTQVFSTLQLPNDGGNPAAEVESIMMRAIAGARNLTSDLGPLTRLIQASIGKVYIAGNLLRPFESATRQGNAVWQDHGGDFWFVSQDGYLPIQPGYGYHSARMQLDAETGEEVPTSTREFYFGPAIGCVENLQVGDKLIVKTTPYANGRSTYQQGDSIEYEMHRTDRPEVLRRPTRLRRDDHRRHVLRHLLVRLDRRRRHRHKLRLHHQTRTRRRHRRRHLAVATSEPRQGDSHHHASPRRHRARR